MSFPGAKVIVACSFLVHFVWIDAKYFLLQFSSTGITLAMMCFEALVLLSFPVIGWLADTHFTRFSVIKVSIILLVVNTVIGVVVSIVVFTYLYLAPNNEGIIYWLASGIVIVFAICIFITVAQGMFEATAYQFGMDQMMEASSDQLSSFIHWYYWSIQCSRGLMVILSVVIDTLLRTCETGLHISNWNITNHTNFEVLLLPGPYVLAPVAFIQGVMSVLALCLLCYNKKHLVIDRTGHSPLTTVYQVLKYSWKHKVPEHRSAFTYWEQDVPSRINLGMMKYGGPFTIEEVENTKTFFRISLVLISLFGLHLADNGYVVTRQLLYHYCPSPITFSAVMSAPNLFSSASIVVMVPVFHYLLLPYCSRLIPNMLHRMGICLATLLVVEFAQVLIILGNDDTNRMCDTNVNILRGCYKHNTGFYTNNTCSIRSYFPQDCPSNDTLFLWLLLPMAVQSFCYNAAFMTALEFICAQAPLRMKGLLIGLWYATSAVWVIVVSSYETQFGVVWYVANGGKCVLILLSLLLYCCVAKHYRYRVRDEMIHIPFMIEEKYERDFQLRDEYQRQLREERTALASTTVPSSYGMPA